MKIETLDTEATNRTVRTDSEESFSYAVKYRNQQLVIEHTYNNKL